MLRLFLACCLLAAPSLFAGGKTETAPKYLAADVAGQDAVPGVTAQNYTSLPPEQPLSGRAEQVMKALAAAYPRRIARAEFRNGDWALFLRFSNEWYYWAEGRLLPENLRGRAAEYDLHPFYNYPADLPPWKEPGPEEAARFRDMANNRSRNPPKRSQHFYEALWRARSREESYERLKTLRFLGHSVMVHYSILEELSLVEERVLSLAKTDPQVRSWINGIASMDTWNWRSIASTQSRSFHSYGAAIDILPKSLGGKETYWLWAIPKKPEWWAVPYAQRFHPPAGVIKAFEAYGFVWGGKWAFYDTMHFEYRPEIMLLNGIPMTDMP